MKTHTFLVLMIIIILVVSCIPSLYPLYREKDLIYDSRLVGRFDIGGDTWEFEKLDWTKPNDFNTDNYKTGKTYRMLAWQDEKRAEFVVHLIKLGNNYYLDFFPVNYKIEYEFLYIHLISVHIFG